MFGKKDNRQVDCEFFTVFDSKSKSYSEPFPAPNKDVLLRDFLNAFKSPDAPEKNRYYRNAEDFSIFRIGTFDMKLGSMEAQHPEHISNLHDLRALAQPDNGPRAL